MSNFLLPVGEAVLGIRQGIGLTRLRDGQGEEHAVIQVANLEPTGIPVADLNREVLEAERVAKYRAKLGQVLISQFTSRLRVALVDQDVVDQGAIVGPNIAIITPDPSVATPDYLLALFSSQAFHARLERLTGGSTQSQIPVSVLKTVEIPVPSMARQQELGRAFRHALAATQAANRLLEAQSTLLEHVTLDLWEASPDD